MPALRCRYEVRRPILVILSSSLVIRWLERTSRSCVPGWTIRLAPSDFRRGLLPGAFARCWANWPGIRSIVDPQAHHVDALASVVSATSGAVPVGFVLSNNACGWRCQR